MRRLLQYRSTLGARIGLALFVTCLGCGSPSTSHGADAGSGPVEDGGVDDGGITSTDAGSDAGVADAGTSPQFPVSFSYTPQWAGVRAVTVIGGFGQANDWMPQDPLLVLQDDGTGQFIGATTLPAGQYSYLFVVLGDADAAHPNTYTRMVVDPLNPLVAACPMGAPTFKASEAYPCSQLIVPQPTASPTYHVHGTVTQNGKPAEGWLVALQRDETGLHPYAVNGTSTDINGAYDLAVTTGDYRLQIGHPTLLSEDDSQRKPLQLQAIRLGVSSTVIVAANTEVPPLEVGYPDYDKLMPTSTMASLPVTFSYTILPGASAARVAVYGLAAAMNTTNRNVGDPWFMSTSGNATAVTWDGTFNTAAAREMHARTGEEYFWGTWQAYPPPQGSVVHWEVQSMVFPLTLQ